MIQPPLAHWHLLSNFTHLLPAVHTEKWEENPENISAKQSQAVLWPTRLQQLYNRRTFSEPSMPKKPKKLTWHLQVGVPSETILTVWRVVKAQIPFETQFHDLISCYRKLVEGTSGPSFEFTGPLRWFPVQTNQIVGLRPRVDQGCELGDNTSFLTCTRRLSHSDSSQQGDNTSILTCTRRLSHSDSSQQGENISQFYHKLHTVVGDKAHWGHTCQWRLWVGRKSWLEAAPIAERRWVVPACQACSHDGIRLGDTGRGGESHGADDAAVAGGPAGGRQVVWR